MVCYAPSMVFGWRLQEMVKMYGNQDVTILYGELQQHTHYKVPNHIIPTCMFRYSREHFLGSSKAFEILANLGLEPLVQGPSTSRYFGKQITAQATQTAWVLQMRQHPRPLVPHDQTNYVLSCGSQFLVKYMGKEHAEHLINCLKEETCKLMEDWTGDLHCGILLRWDYKAQNLDISMPGYIKKQLLKYEHIM